MIFAFEFFPFCIGLIGAQKIIVGGEIYVGEILSFLYLIVNYEKLKIDKSLGHLLLLGVVWAVCQWISDQINQTEILNSIKGVGAPLVLISTIAALMIYFGHNLQRMPSFLIGIDLGCIVEFIFFPHIYFQDNPWKWGLGSMFLGLFAVYFTFFLQKKRNVYLFGFLIVFGVIGIFYNARNLSMLPLFSAIAYIFLQQRRFSVIFNEIYDRFGFTVVALGGISLLILINAVATEVFTSSWVLDRLPQDSAMKFKTQSEGGVGVFLGGRTEMFASVEAFLDKPFLGHGSWAMDNYGYTDLMIKKLYELGYTGSGDASIDIDLIPAHSYLMGTFVWAGIGGGLFWLFMIRWLSIEFIKNLSFIGFYFYNGVILMLWDILFSPFGASHRFTVEVFIAAYASYLLWLSNHRVTE